MRAIALFLILINCGCTDANRTNRQSASTSTAQRPPNPQSREAEVIDDKIGIAWRASDVAGNKLHLVDQNQIAIYRFDADGTAAGRVYDLGMVEMFWKIDTDGKLVICDDSDFQNPHSSLRLDAWDGEKALVYNEIVQRKEEYFRQRPRTLTERKLHLQQLLSGADADP